MSFNCCYPLLPKNERVKQAARLLKIVGEENRLKILCLLQEGSLCVCEIFEKLGLAQNLTSHHLGVLKEACLVDDKKRGLRVYYSLTKRGRKITRIILKLAAKEVENESSSFGIRLSNL